MNLYGFLVVLAVLAVIVGVVERYGVRLLRLAERRADNRERRTMAQVEQAREWRDMQKAEREEKVRTARRSGRRVTEIPDDLNALIMEESEKWTRDEMRQGMQDSYAEYGDWNMVRRAYGVGGIGAA